MVHIIYCKSFALQQNHKTKCVNLTVECLNLILKTVSAQLNASEIVSQVNMLLAYQLCPWLLFTSVCLCNQLHINIQGRMDNSSSSMFKSLEVVIGSRATMILIRHFRALTQIMGLYQ